MTGLDTHLIQRAKHGDQEALGAIYDRLYPSVFRYIYYRVSDQETAEDLAGDVFVRMVERIGAFEQHGSPILAWLYTIARNLVADHYRLRGQTNSLPLKESLAVGETIQPSEKVERRQKHNCLAKAMDCLTEGQREVILLKFIEGRDIVEVAEVLGKNERAIRSLQHRALAALNRMIEKENCYER